jgi:FtsP/CotA-like multicopper oxidase with cupredoxin domain
MLYSRHGELHVDLVAAPAAYTLGDQQFQGMLYNGQYLPPVWRLQSGDRLTVTLRNRSSEETNLHFHGIDASPLKNSDNVFIHIRPGETFT